MENNEISASITIKVKYLNEIRRFAYLYDSSDASWNNLLSKILKLFSLDSQPKKDSAKIRYVDEENDLITISSNAELLAAIEQANGGILKLFVATNNEEEKIIDKDNYYSKLITIDISKKKENNKNNNEKYTKIEISQRKGFDDNLKTLEDFGFKDAKLNMRIMKRHYYGEEDFSKIVDILCQKSESQKFALERKRKRDQKKMLKYSNDANNDDNAKNMNDDESTKFRKCQEKQALKEEKQKIREENKKLREEKKKHRLEELEKKRKLRNDDKEMHEDINALAWGDISEIYLDGNNMLYLCSFLRNMMLKKRGGKQSIEKLLGSIAWQYGKSKGLKKVVMIYDATRLSEHDKGDASIGIPEYRLCCARPAYSTSDDQLVAWSKQKSSAENAACIYVTSDRELCRRLKENGVRLIKPKAWLLSAMLEDSEGDLQENDLDYWLEKKAIALDSDFNSCSEKEEKFDDSSD